MMASNDHIADGASSDSYPPSVSSRTTTLASLSEAASRMNAHVPFDEEESKELLLCTLYILKNLDQGTTWLKHQSLVYNNEHFITGFLLLHFRRYN